MNEKANIAMIGMGVMGENLAMNIESHGYTIAIYDIVEQTINKFMLGRGKDRKFIACHSLREVADNLHSPRIIFIMIKAGDPVDQTIEKLIPLLSKGDIIIDGGNSNFEDTQRRAKYLENLGLNFIGSGVSGGEEGALHGPCLMPGGSRAAWEFVKPIFNDIAAKLPSGEQCCTWIGSDGAGHFVKMVHNGIEYGDMQLICETYDLMRKVLNLSEDTMSEIFSDWNKGELNSYLIQITSEILKYKDTDGQPLIRKILDTAGQKGTGKWASISALNEGIPLTLITEAVYARFLSAKKEERVEAQKHFEKQKIIFYGDKAKFISDLKDALYASKIISYAQGFSLLKSASDSYNWNLPLGDIALIFRGGCIIRSAFLGKINDAFKNNPGLPNLMLDDYFKDVLAKTNVGFRNVVAYAITRGIPIPAMSSALAYFDGYTSAELPQNLLQAQRDYFGAHTYERNDTPRGQFHHTNWTGEGGDTTAGSYNA